MDNEQDAKSGYKRPPRHTRFKPGQSGNPSGRPKKKGTTFTESLQKELRRLIIISEGGTRKKMSKLDAIMKQQMNKAIQGDPKSTALIMSALEKRDDTGLDTLSPMLQAMQAIHASHESAKQNDIRMADGHDLGAQAAVDHQHGDDDQD